MLHIYADGTSIYDPLTSSLYLIAPKLKLEWGKAGALEFAVPSTHSYYNKFQQLKTVVTVELDGIEIFRGRVLSIERDFNNTKSVSCEGDLAYLVDSVQRAEKYEGTTHDLFRKIIWNHNQRVEAYKQFSIGQITIENRDIVLSGQTDDIDQDEDEDEEDEDEDEEDEEAFDYKQIAINSMADNWNNTYDYIKSCLIDYCGGYLRTRRVGNTTYIDLLESAGDTASQEIRFGENLLDLTEEITSEDLFTVLVPLGDENLTIASVNGGSDELEDAAAVALYGRIVKTNVFQNVTSPETLKENGWRYLEANIHIPTTITVKAIDLTLAGNANVSAIRVGDRVHINSSPHRLVEYLTCTEIEYDFASPENTIYTFGNPKQTLTQRYREDRREQNDTYGNGIGSYASSGIGASSLALAERSKNQANKLADKIYKEWIDIDPDNPDGIGSLGGLYQLFDKNRKILENEVGIKFDASSGNINLYALSERVNKNTNDIEKARADFTASTEVIDGRLTAVAAMQASYKTETDEKIGRLELTANELGSKLTAKVDVVDFQAEKQRFVGLTEDIDKYKRKLKTEVGIDLDSTTGNLNLYSMSERINENTTRIEKARADFTASTQVIDGRLTSIASMQASYKTETDEKIGYLELRANELGTSLTAKVDVVDFQAEKQRFTGLTEEIDAYKRKLKKEVGIDLDSTTGNLNLYSLSERIDENGQQIESARADFTASTQVIDGRLTSIASMQASYKTETDEKIGLLELRANELGTTLTAKVDVVDFQAEKQRFVGLTEDIDKYKRKLKTEVGIDLDSTTGNLNLYSMSERITENTTRVEKARADFTASTQVIDGRLTSIASMQASYKTETDEKIGSLELRADSLGTSLNAKVNTVDFQAEKQRFTGFTEQFDTYKRRLKNDVGIDLDATTGNLNLYSMSERITDNTTRVEKARADFTASTKDINGRLTSIASMQASYKTETDEKIGSLELRADSLGTSLNAKVDVVDFQAEKQRFTGFSNQFDTYKRRLKNDVGIDLDATTGNININALSTKVDTNGQLIAQNSARITTTANDLGSQVNIVAQGLNRTDANVASIQVKQTNLESSITLKADKTVIDSELTTIKGRLNTAEADITTLKARSITANEIKAKLAEIDVVDVRGLNANSIYAKNQIQIGTGSNNQVPTVANVNTKLNDIGKSGSPGTNHYHEISVNSDGTVTLGKATTSAQSFKISDTKAYRDGVSAAASAVTITELDRDEHFEDTYNSTTHVTTVHLQAVASNGKTKGANIEVSGAKAYREGMSAGAAEATESVDISDVVRRVVTGYGTERYNVVDHTTTVFGIATASNGKSKEFDFTTGTQAYNAGVTKGQSDVTITSLERSQNDYYNTVSHKTIVYAKAIASNGETKTEQFFTDTTAYDAGYNNVTVSIPDTNVTLQNPDLSNCSFDFVVTAKASNGQTATYNENWKASIFKVSSFDISLSPASSNPKVDAYKYYNATVVAKNSKGQELARTTRQIADATMYNRGYEDGSVVEEVVPEPVTISSIYRRADDYYDSASHNTLVYVQAKTSEGSIGNQNFWVDGSKAFNAGKSAGGGSISSIYRRKDDYYNSYSHDTIVYIQASDSNGNTKNQDFWVDGSEAYYAGEWSVGVSDFWVAGKQMTGSKITAVMIGVTLSSGKDVYSGWVSTNV